MDRKELTSLLKGNLENRNVANFADSNEAVRNALMEFYGVTEDMDFRSLKRAVKGDFSIIEDVIDEVLPKALENIMGGWAKVLSFGRDEEVVYKIKGLGKRRALLGLVPGARSGMYKAYRLDDKNLSISTKTYTAGASVSLEDILLGRLTLGEMLDNILLSIQYQIYKDIVKAMRTAKTLAPQANKATGDDFDSASIDRIIRVISAYGTPVMVCFSSFAAKINNVYPGNAANPNMPASDLDAWKAQGYISAYKGTNVIVLPNFILDENTNDSWAFAEGDCFILPVAEKPVIVALRGESVVVEHTLPSGGEELQLSKMMGTAIVAYNNLGVYTDSNIVAAQGEI